MPKVHLNRASRSEYAPYIESGQTGSWRRTMTGTIERERQPSLDAVLSAVADERRRTVLRVLDHSDGGTMEFSTLVDQITRRGRVDDGVADEHRQRVRTALHHKHLPKLEACGLIVHDTEVGQVESVDNELSRELLTTIESYEGHD